MENRNMPATPGLGPEGLPTPSLPDQQPATPGPGPVELPTPALPGPPYAGNGAFRCPYGYQEAVVQYNQTFTDLLLAHNVSYQALRSANPNLSTFRPAPGTRYCVPPSGSRRLCAAGSSSYVMEPGDTLYTLSRMLGVSEALLLRTNPTLAPGDFLPGRVICLPDR